MYASQHDATISATTLYHLAGLALLLGSLLSLVGMVLGFLIPGPLGQEGPSAVPVALLGLVATIVILWGLPAMYVKQAERAGRLGLLGFLLVVTALVLELGHSIIDAFLVPSITLPAKEPGGIVALTIITALVGMLGSIGFGIATIRASVFPRGAGILLLLTTVTLLHAGPLPSSLVLVVDILSGLFTSLALGWFGYALVTPPAPGSAQLGSVVPGALR